MPSNHFILCYPFLLLPSIFSSIGVFSNESVLCIRWPKYWSFSFSISPSSEYSGLTSFRKHWIDFLAVQGTLKSLLQHQSLKASNLWCSAFFIVQLSHLYMTTGKTIALTRWTFVGKVMSLIFNMLSRLVIASLPSSKCLLISWLQSLSEWFWSPLNKVSHCFHCFSIYLPLSSGTRCHDLSFLNNIQPWHTPFPIWNQSVVPRPVLTVASWPAYRFLRRQVRWSGIPISFRIFQSLWWSTQSKALVYSLKQK